MRLDLELDCFYFMFMFIRGLSVESKFASSHASPLPLIAQPSFSLCLKPGLGGHGTNNMNKPSVQSGKVYLEGSAGENWELQTYKRVVVVRDGDPVTPRESWLEGYAVPAVGVGLDARDVSVRVSGADEAPQSGIIKLFN